MTIFHYEKDADGIAVISWDLPEKSMNILTDEGIAELSTVMDQAIEDTSVKGIIITSSKADFAGGMDLNILARMRENAGDDPAHALYEGVMRFHHLLRKIERAGADPKTNKGGKPVIWAGRGICAGIGTEIALACHYRLMSDHKRGKIGLPEIKLGLFPGAGGTTRVVRMLGLMASSPILLEGTLFEPKGAQAIGLVDEVVSDENLLVRARAWVLAAQPEDIIKPWDKKGYKLPGGGPYHPAGAMNFIGANAMVHGKTQGVYPAARAMLSAIYEGVQLPFDRALEVECRYFTHVLMDPSSRAMIETLFIDKSALEKGAHRPDVPDQSVRKLGILGAGMMGAGIAFIALRAGIEVVLLDQNLESARRGAGTIEALIDSGIKRGKTTPEKKTQMMALLTPSEHYADLAGADLVIEAVFEDPKIKASAIKAALEAIGPDVILATNTSTLPVTGLGETHPNPQNFIGMHFFSPVHKMPLLEIIKGAQTGGRAVAKALDFARQTGKTPIVVNDSRFFYANRCIIPYLNEGIRMVAEGVPPTMIENAAKSLGFPLGPLQLTDEISLELGVRIAKATKSALGAAYDDGADLVLFTLFDMGRIGKKANQGFYDYDEKGKRLGLWPELSEKWPPHYETFSYADIKNRLMMIQVLEALRALEENVLLDVREGDVGAILGWGFAPWSGGPFHYLDTLGAEQAASICADLAARFGARFSPPRILQEKAKNRQRFVSS